jgi:BON domain
MRTMLRPLLLVALAWPVPGTAQPASAASEPALRNWFGDPFFQIANALPDCPEPAGPRIGEAERQKQSHHRAERGTTCWLAGQCDRPNSYAYDADIAAAVRLGLAGSNPFAGATIWVTVQGRVVYFEGCVPAPAMAAALETFARGIPNVQQAIAAVRVTGDATRPPYRLMSVSPAP